MTLSGVVMLSLKRHKLRSVLTILGVSSTVIGFLLLRTASEVWSARTELARDDLLISFNSVALFQPIPKLHADTIAQRVTGAAYVSGDSYFRAYPLGEPRQSIGVDAVGDAHHNIASDVSVDPRALELWAQTPQAALVGDMLAKQLHWRQGDAVTLVAPEPIGEIPIVVAGTYKGVTRTVDRNRVILHYDYFDRFRPEADRGTILVVQTLVKPGHDPIKVAREIDLLFDASVAPTLTTTAKAMSKGMDGALSSLFRGLDLLSAIVLVLMSVVVSNTIGMAVAERTTEYAVLRALGFEPLHLSLMVLGETVLVTGLGALVGLGVGLPVLNAFGRFLSENVGKLFPYFEVSSRSVTIVLVVSLCLGVCATILPAIRAARTPVANALRRT